MAITKLNDEFKKILVTGGAGFIGSHICEQAVKQGREVICLDNFVAGRMDNVAHLMDTGLITIVDGDVTDGVILMKTMEGVDVVFHNAASKCTVCIEDPHLDLSVNAWGTMCVARTAIFHEVKRFVHASTGTVKGIGGKAASYYGVSKQAGEKYLEALSSYRHDFKPAILRYHHVYGPRQAGEPSGGVVPIFIERAMYGKPLMVHGGGKQRRHFTHVLDVVNANFRAANMDDALTVDVANKTWKTILYLANAVKGYFPGTEIIPDDPKPGDISTFEINDDFLQDPIDFETGLKDTVGWYAAQA